MSQDISLGQQGPACTFPSCPGSAQTPEPISGASQGASKQPGCFSVLPTMAEALLRAPQMTPLFRPLPMSETILFLFQIPHGHGIKTFRLVPTPCFSFPIISCSAGQLPSLSVFPIHTHTPETARPSLRHTHTALQTTSASRKPGSPHLLP